MSTITRFEDMEVWQHSRGLCNRIYGQTLKGKFAKDFGLRDQIRRASVSVLSNIAEGFESRTTGLFIEFLGRAKASAGEVRSQLYISYDLGYLSESDFVDLKKSVESISRQLSGLIKYLSSYKDSNLDNTVKESILNYKST